MNAGVLSDARDGGIAPLPFQKGGNGEIWCINSYRKFLGESLSHKIFQANLRKFRQRILRNSKKLLASTLVVRILVILHLRNCVGECIPQGRMCTLKLRLLDRSLF